MNNNKELNEIQSNIKLLEEQVKISDLKADVKVLEERLESYKKLVLIIFGVLTFIGLPSIYYMINNLVTTVTTNKLDTILKDKYIEKQIGIRAKKAINKLIEETENRAKDIVERYSTFEDWKWRAGEAVTKRDYKNAEDYYKKALEKILLFSYSMDDWEKDVVASLYLELAEVQIINGSYEDALKSVNEAQPLSYCIGTTASTRFLKCIVNKFLNIDIASAENELYEIIKDDFHFGWDISIIEKWWKNADIAEDIKVYIQDKIELIQKQQNRRGN